jgi:hypothetical protein
MMPILRAAKQSFEHSTGLKAEFEAIRLIALHGSPSIAFKTAKMLGLNPMIVSTLQKASAPAMTTISADGAIPAGFAVWPAFEGAVRTVSVFDAIAAEAVTMPFFMRVGMFASALTAAKVSEGVAKLAQLPMMTQGTLTPEKFVALAAATNEFLRDAPNAFESFARQLMAACATAADTEFLSDINASNSDGSNGEPFTLTGIQSDILLMLLPMVDYSQRSSLVLVVSLDQARAMTYVAMAAGINTMTPLGGTFGGIRVVVTDALPANTISLIDLSRARRSSSGRATRRHLSSRRRRAKRP